MSSAFLSDILGELRDIKEVLRNIDRKLDRC